MADIVEYRWAPSPRIYRLTHNIFAPPLAAYFHLQSQGVEHIPETGAVVLACNHLSNLDPVLLAVACPRPINYLAKIELFRVPILGALIRRYGAIPLRRSASDPEAIRLAEQVLEQQQLLALFPEGTRSRTGQLKPFRFGAARLALKYRALLIPAAISGTDRAMPAGAKIPHRVPIRIVFGPPIATEPYHYHGTGRTPEVHLLETVTNLLQAEVRRLKEMIEASG
ncbi:MAG TPA: lysophospholipid acyltransferase family protein [Herpetosiphonaceae bacterium]